MSDESTRRTIHPQYIPVRKSALKPDASFPASAIVRAHLTDGTCDVPLFTTPEAALKYDPKVVGDEVVLARVRDLDHLQHILQQLSLDGVEWIAIDPGNDNETRNTYPIAVLIEGLRSGQS